MIRLSEHVAHFQRRILEDGLLVAMPSTYRQRADMFDWARPKPNDYTGKATQKDLADLDERCRLVAEACRRHANLLELGLPDYIRDEIDDVMGRAA